MHSFLKFIEINHLPNFANTFIFVHGLLFVLKKLYDNDNSYYLLFTETSHAKIYPIILLIICRIIWIIRLHHTHFPKYTHKCKYR